MNLKIKQLIAEVQHLCGEVNRETEMFALVCLSKYTLLLKIGKTDYHYIPEIVYESIMLEHDSDAKIIKALNNYKKKALALIKEQNPETYKRIKDQY